MRALVGFSVSRSRLTALVLALVIVSGCSEPLWSIPGGKLEGKESPLTVAALPAEAGVLQLETRLEDPYSVNIGFVRIGDSIYIDPAPDRGWYQHIAQNPAVRVRFDGQQTVHPATAVAVQSAEILAQFDETRVVLRLQPRI